MLNLVGHLEAEVGVGEVARQLVGACDAAGVPVLPISLPAWASRQGHPFPHAAAPVAAFGTTLVCLNADQLPRAARGLRPVLERRRRIGLWWWEAPTFPPWLAESFALVDEVWAGSAWLADVLRGAAPEGVAVRHLPLPVRVPRPARMDRRALGLPEERFLFGLAFDHGSILARKNPLGLIEAYRRAFGPDDGCALLVKSVNGAAHPAAHAQVLAAAADRPDVIVRDGYLDADVKDALLATCDCWASLHRSEGFGLTLAEAMGLGVPVLATGWSGNADFTHDATAWVVPSGLVPIGPGHDPYPAEGEWADPDLDAAAALMRRVRAEPEERARRVAAGRAWIAAHHAPEVVGGAIAELLADAPPGPPAREPARALVALLAERRSRLATVAEDPHAPEDAPPPPGETVAAPPAEAAGAERLADGGGAEPPAADRGGAERPADPTPAPSAKRPADAAPPAPGAEQVARARPSADPSDAAGAERPPATASRADRATLSTRVERAEALLAAGERRLAEAERRAAQNEITALERDEACVEADELATRLEVAAADNAKLEARIASAQRVHEAMQASLSWRITRPIRAVKERARR